MKNFIIGQRDEARSLLNEVPARAASSLRFLDMVALEEISSTLSVQDSPANVQGMALHGLCPSGVLALVVPSDRAAQLRQTWAVLLTQPRAIMRALSTTRPIGGGILPEYVRVLYPGDVLRFGGQMPQGVSFVIFNMNTAGSPIAGNSGTSVADAKMGLAPMLRFYFDDPGPLQRIGYVPTPYRYPPIAVPTVAPIFGNGSGFYLSPAARRLTLRFLATGGNRLAAEVADVQLWFRDMNDGYWMHHPADDMTTGRRGQIDTLHDVETFILPGTADMFCPVRASGPAINFCYQVIDQ